MRPIRLFLVIAVLASSVPSHAFQGQEKRLAQIEAALGGGRLIQARRMLERTEARPEDRYRVSLAWADLLLGEGRDGEAFAHYVALSQERPADARPATGAGLAALRLRRHEEARNWLVRATALENADWRAWNGLGVASDFLGDWSASETAYKKALEREPARAAIWNNFGYSLTCQRRMPEAVAALAKAASLAPQAERIRANLEIARSLSGQYPTRRRPGEDNAEWAARLNNAGYSAWLAGDRDAARSLLSRAIAASAVRFERAEANLRLVENAN